MNLWRDIRLTLTAQLTVSVVNNRVIWCLYNDNVRCVPVAITLSMTKHSLIFWMANHIPALTTKVEIDVTHAVEEILNLTDSYTMEAK